MTAKLPVIAAGSTAATTAFCSARLDGVGHHGEPLHLWFDGNGKITAGNGTLKEPRPNAFSLPAAGVSGIEHCPQSTPTCRKACLASTHKVLTADLRYIPLRDIQVGDRLVSFDEEKQGDNRRRHFRTGTVRAIRHEVRDVLHVTLESGKQFWATPDHEWLVRSSSGGNHDWRRTDELMKLTSYDVPRYFDEWEPATSFEAGWLAGMYDGEGCLYSSGSTCALTLSQKEGPVLDRARRAIESVLGESSHAHTAQSRDVAQLRITGGRYQVLKALGILRPTRLLPKFSPDQIGELLGIEHEKIRSVELGGQTEITLIDIDCGTMIVEGYPHHNCYVENLAIAQGATYALYLHNAKTIQTILDGCGNDPKYGMVMTSLAMEWAQLVAVWIEENAPEGFRWHVSGDIYSKAYAEWIAEVCRQSPNVRHWIYTRSFDFLEPLVEVSTTHGGNLSINLSCDQDNYEAAKRASDGWPPQRLRLNYLTVDGKVPDDLHADDVIFPDYQLRPKNTGSLADSDFWQGLTQFQRGLVCPVDSLGKSEKIRCGLNNCSRCLK